MNQWGVIFFFTVLGLWIALPKSGLANEPQTTADQAISKIEFKQVNESSGDDLSPTLVLSAGLSLIVLPPIFSRTKVTKFV